MTKADTEPILEEFKNNLTDKNVSSEIADQIVANVEKSLIKKTTASFTSVKATVQEALVEAIAKLLTPKRNIDILKEAISAKK
jgi:signal recognition particle receptor subunit alpha